jgi:hypothetical protein
MTKEYISNDNNLTPVEKFIKLQIPNKKKWECTNLILHTLLCQQ